MSQPWIVLKFGGTSVSTHDNWKNIQSIIERRRDEGKRVFLVASALGGISNRLEALCEAKGMQDTEVEMAYIKEKHLSLANDLGIDGERLLAPFFEGLFQLLTGVKLLGEVSPRSKARIMAIGELMSTTLGAAYLQKADSQTTWLDARKALKLNNEVPHSDAQRYLSATCDYELDVPWVASLEQDNPVIVTQGFIASNEYGETVLLGRGGSDTSAAYFAAKLNAERCEIWTDVPGMFTANPREIPSARLLLQLGYAEAQEIATTGAKVLHPRCLFPLKQTKIPMHICCTTAPEMPGTVISEKSLSQGPSVKAISVKKDVLLVTMDTVGMWQQVGFLADAFEIFKKHHLSIDLVSTSETNVTVSLDVAANAADNQTLNALLRDLSPLCQARVIEPCAAVSLVGRKIRGILHRLGPALEVFEDHKVHLVSQAASDLNLTFVVEEQHAAALTKKLHSLLFLNKGQSVTFGETWEKLFQSTTTRNRAHQRWWETEREALVALAQHTTPAYAYHVPSLRHTAQELMSLKNIDRIFFAMKANSHDRILKIFHEAGLGFECVSPGEIEKILSLFPDIDRRRILFTPNFAPKKDYEIGLSLGVNVTLDNLFPLQSWPEIFKNKDVFLRMDPGTGRGHHDHVKTAGKHAKFGIPLFEMDELQKAVKASGVQVVGLHAHQGSGILNPQNWVEIASVLLSVAALFPTVKYLDVGGGLGVVEKPSQLPLDLQAVDAIFADMKRANPKYEIWLEPGRFLVAQSGVVLAKVTQTKGKDDVKYLGVDAGMHTLIRPSLYGAYHEIKNLSRLDQDGGAIYTVVGPICESGDTLGHDRFLPLSKEGDVMVIGTAGAYGRTMSSDYNMRGLPQEFFIGDEG
jgi:bifunctional diaminopimelate decarboxylase / aspartate kinase